LEGDDRGKPGEKDKKKMPKRGLEKQLELDIIL